MTITLQLPPQQLKPNGRYHWRAKAAKVAQYRADARYAAMAAAYDCQQAEALSAATVRVRAFWPTVRKMDPDNLLATMKAAFDGFTDAGIWLDDREITFLPSLQDKDAANPRIEIDVW